MRRDENVNVEYKESWHDKYLEWICGYANAEGGTLYIGIEDGTKTPVGVKNSKKLMEDIPNSIRNTMGIVADVKLLKKESKDIIRIVVKPSSYPVSYDGRYHYRTGSVKMVLTGNALSQFLMRKMNIEWDASETYARLPFRKFTFKRLKLRYETKSGRQFQNKWFESMGLKTNSGVLTNAGALFADDCPIPHSRLFCTIWNGNTKSRDAIDDKEYAGNLIELLDAAERFVKDSTRNGWVKRDTDRQNYPAFPERAVTEAIVNALIHRDYTISGSEVHLDLYDDRLEVVSPGGMMDGSFVQDRDLRNIASERRNKILADIFNQMDYMERKGSGFGLILDAYEFEAPNPENKVPQFISTVSSFHVVLPRLDKQSNDYPTNRLMPGPESRPESRPESSSSEIRAKILEILSNGPTGKAGISNLLGHKSLSGSTKKQIKDLLVSGVIERTIPDKPNSRLQKYRLTDKGRKEMMNRSLA